MFYERRRLVRKACVPPPPPAPPPPTPTARLGFAAWSGSPVCPPPPLPPDCCSFGSFGGRLVSGKTGNGPTLPGRRPGKQPAALAMLAMLAILAMLATPARPAVMPPVAPRPARQPAMPERMQHEDSALAGAPTLRRSAANVHGGSRCAAALERV